MTVRSTTLANGMTVLTDDMPHLESASLGIWVKAGSRSETEAEHGISHMLEHMAFKGTTTRNAMEIASTIENVGGDLNAATSVEHTGYFARVAGLGPQGSAEARPCEGGLVRRLRGHAGVEEEHRVLRAECQCPSGPR